MTHMRTNTQSNGFTLAELLIVLTITGILAGIGVPVFLNARTSAGNEAVNAALNSVAESINSRLIQWQGIPPTPIGVCNTSVTYPTAPPPTNTCDDQTWNTAILPSGSAITPALNGTLPAGITILGHVDNIGRFCLDATSDITGTSPWHLTSDMSEPATGTCFTAGWVPNSGSITPDSNLPSNPPPPTGLYFTTTGNGGKVINWEATAGAQYLVTFDGQTYQTVTPSTTGNTACAFPGSTTTCSTTATGPIPAGTYIATVRQLGTNGWGAAATLQINVN